MSDRLTPKKNVKTKKRARKRKSAPKRNYAHLAAASLQAGLVTFGRISVAGLARSLSALAAVWRYIGVLDLALWRGFKRGAYLFWRGFVHIGNALLYMARDLWAWLPSRAGRAYCALSGFFLLIGLLWGVDTLSKPVLQTASDGAVQARAPFDEKDPIMARMGGRYVHLSQVAASARAAGVLRGEDVLTVQGAFERGLVDAYVQEHLLAAIAQEEGIDREKEVTRRLKAARNRILASAYLENYVDKKVTPEAVRALYDAQSDVTRLGDEVTGRQIVVETREQADTLLAEITAGGDFAELAKAHSLDEATARFGGRIDYFTKQMVTPKFARVAFATKPGETAPLFQSEFGWHILQITDRRPTAGVAFEAVQDNIAEFLEMRAIEEVVAGLKAAENVIYYEPTPIAAALRSGPGAPPPGAEMGDANTVGDIE